MNIYIIHPKLQDYTEDIFSGGRKGKEFVANTGFLYIKANDERPNWFEFTILGFGLGFSWGYDEWESFK